jgi:adenine deaminase
MKIQIREGSAVQNFEDLVGLIRKYPDMCMFASDDKHPDELVQGHINQLVKRTVAKGIDVFKVLQVACINPIKHYDLDVGTLKTGDMADFIVVDDLRNLNVLTTYIDGNVVAHSGKTNIEKVPTKLMNKFEVEKIKIGDLRVFSQKAEPKVRVI